MDSADQNRRLSLDHLAVMTYMPIVQDTIKKSADQIPLDYVFTSLVS